MNNSAHIIINSSDLGIDQRNVLSYLPQVDHGDTRTNVGPGLPAERQSSSTIVANNKFKLVQSAIKILRAHAALSHAPTESSCGRSHEKSIG